MAVAMMADLEPAPDRLAQHFSLEATRPTADEVARIKDMVPPGTMIYLTAVPNQTAAELTASAARLRRAGLEPVAHIAARRLAGRDPLRDLLKALRGEADMRRLLVIGGDVDETGPLPDALAVIREGDLGGLGFEEIGIGGYPEGHPRIAPGRLEAALDEKIALGVAQGLRVHIVSQFSFSPDRIVAWLRQMRGCGILRPVQVGIVGPTSVPALLRFARRCGVNASLRGLVSGVATSLVGHVGPGRIIEALSDTQDLGDIALHYFSFGGLVETARYACQAAAGRHDVHRAMAHPN
ncbi:MAG TPA: methylenetetrahydrofolate reductase [Pseudolabrys sp.]|nr:methylenetetrahydrofolate reductase [Pseudolabrys sp.]